MLAHAPAYQERILIGRPFGWTKTGGVELRQRDGTVAIPFNLESRKILPVGSGYAPHRAIVHMQYPHLLVRHRTAKRLGIADAFRTSAESDGPPRCPIAVGTLRARNNAERNVTSLEPDPSDGRTEAILRSPLQPVRSIQYDQHLQGQLPSHGELFCH